MVIFLYRQCTSHQLDVPFLITPQFLTLSSMPSGIHNSLITNPFYPQPLPWTLPSSLGLTEIWLSPEVSCSSLNFFFSPYSLLPLSLEVRQVSSLLLELLDLPPPQKLYFWISCQEIINNSHLTTADIYQIQNNSFPLFLKTHGSWLVLCNTTTLLLFLQFQYIHTDKPGLLTFPFYFSFSNGSFPPAYW